MSTRVAEARLTPGCRAGLHAFFTLLTLLLMTCFSTVNSSAQTQPPTGAQPQKVEDLLKLLGDPEVQKWLSTQKPVEPAKAFPVDPTQDLSFSAFLSRIRNQVSSLIAAVPTLPEEFAKAVSALRNELNGRGLGSMILLFAVFIAAGFVVQWLFWQVSSPWRKWMAAARLDTPRERLIAISARLVFSVGQVLAFALGSIGVFLAFEWPRLLREIMIGYLAAVVMLWLARVLLEVLLSPPNSKTIGDADQLRIIPVTSETATFWNRRLSYAIGWFAFGWVTISLLATLGVPRPTQQLTAYTLGVILLIIGLEAVWRRPGRNMGPAFETVRSRISGKMKAWFWSIYFFALWLMWVAGTMRLFWLAVVIVALPGAAMLVQKAVRNVSRSPGTTQGIKEAPSVLVAVIERGLLVFIIVVGIIFLANAWGIELTEITSRDTFAMRAVRGVFSAAVIVLIADFVWHVVKTVLNRTLAEAQEIGEPGSEGARRRARTRTLLPILRNVLMIVVAIVAVLMALSSMGVEIGPLIAGAGVVGVAIGFGAQTVVKDIISGMFYLLDDAFRVGEYIQSGTYKGTVESFSLRSVKLRHQRGAIYIVPFSELGAVQNMSRDWSIEKITMTVTYDSDVDMAKKIVKKIGLELAEDPEFKASTIEPLKMQGVDNFGDSGMELRMKLMTRPGEQFGIKRRALMMIKKAFDENGIKLAVPTVQVSGAGESETAAAAQKALALRNAALPATLP